MVDVEEEEAANQPELSVFEFTGLIIDLLGHEEAGIKEQIEA